MRYRPYFLGLYLVVFIAISSGCVGATITKEKAIQLVKQQHEKESAFGEIHIISVTHKLGEYVVKWELKNNCETGTDYVSVRTGKITHGVHSIC